VLAIAPIIGIVLGFVARSQVKKGSQSQGARIALFGIIVGFIGAAWWIWFWTISIFTNFGGH
jgi:uncharacterized membrane protein YeaQ/YmgE (transglycosylase-associated protein family)